MLLKFIVSNAYVDVWVRDNIIYLFEEFKINNSNIYSPIPYSFVILKYASYVNDNIIDDAFISLKILMEELDNALNNIINKRSSQNNSILGRGRVESEKETLSTKFFLGNNFPDRSIFYTSDAQGPISRFLPSFPTNNQIQLAGSRGSRLQFIDEPELEDNQINTGRIQKWYPKGTPYSTIDSAGNRVIKHY